MPYRSQPAEAFWRSCAADPEFLAHALHRPKFALTPETPVAAAGSCFAQHIAKRLKASDAAFLDVEPGPRGMPEAVAARFGYGLYSARYGNVYSARQFRQLLEDALKGRVRVEAIWARDGRFVDALRPTVEPEGLESAEEALAQRRDHLAKVKRLMGEAEVFIFTLGLTEMWGARRSGQIYPTAPGVVAGAYDEKAHVFTNATVTEVRKDLEAALKLLRRCNRDARLLLTVSPVPLSATATGGHVFTATQHSKAVLRAAAGELAAADPRVDYFPSYELVTGLPFGMHFTAPDAREVSEAGVAHVMSAFFAAHPGLSASPPAPAPDGEAATDGEPASAVCEELLLDQFARP